MPISLSPEQERARTAILNWYRSPDRKPYFYLEGGAGRGKQQPIDCMVQTPAGAVPIGSLKVGDTVLHPSEGTTTVVGVYPQGIQQAYRITFRDGFSTECGKEHLWQILSTKKKTLQPRTVSLGWIMERGLNYPNQKRSAFKFKIPLCLPVDYPEADLPLPPYFVGALIGDGTNLGYSPVLCCPDYEIAYKCVDLVPGHELITNLSSNCPRHRFHLIGSYTGKRNPLGVKFKELGLGVKSPERFIPVPYLYASVSQRIELLRGLMDTDGCCKNNRTSFSTKSIQLAKDLCLLVQSLGGTGIMRTQYRTDKALNKDGSVQIEYEVNVKVNFNPFTLPKKAGNWSPSRKNPPSRYIFNISPSRMCEQVCIKVSAEDGLYLTDNYIVTHNTSVITATTQSISGKVVYIAPTAKAALVMRRKGCTDARTAHSAIYIPKGLSGNRKLVEMLRELQEAPTGPKAEYLKSQCRPLLEFELSKAIAAHEQRKVDKKNNNLQEPDRLVALRKALSTNISNPRDLVGANPIFERNDDSIIKEASLVVCDEVSMMSDIMVDDLLSFGVPILAQGDSFQLPPVNACAYFSGIKADFTLTEIHRQAKDSPIIQLAEMARLGKRIRPGKYGDCEVITYSDKDAALAADQIIVGTNKQRHITNDMVRKLKGFNSPMPEPGDRVICRNNDSKLGLINGDQFTVKSFQDGKFKCRVGIENDDISTTVDAHKVLFQGKEVKDLNPWQKKDAQCLQYAYSISGHLSQGSEFDDVYLIDESSVFGHNASRHRYTCISRAAKRITIRQ